MKITAKTTPEDIKNRMLKTFEYMPVSENTLSSNSINKIKTIQNMINETIKNPIEIEEVIDLIVYQMRYCMSSIDLISELSLAEKIELYLNKCRLEDIASSYNNINKPKQNKEHLKMLYKGLIKEETSIN